MKTTIGEVKKMVAKAINETRGKLTPQEVLTTYEDLFIKNGSVPVEMLASFMGAEQDPVFQAAMQRAGLLVDRNGNVVERGMAPRH